MKNKKGFTLSEVLVVIAIISIIMLIAVPSVVLVTKRINRRLFESKKELFLVAAEQYARDNTDAFSNFELNITLNELLAKGYIEKDKSKIPCDEEAYPYGCIFNPINDEILNETPILIVQNQNKYLAYWNETNNGKIVKSLEKIICEKLSGTKNGGEDGRDAAGNSCTCSISDDVISLGDSESCYFISDDPSNWLLFENVEFRIMGLEKKDANYRVVMITQTPI